MQWGLVNNHQNGFLVENMTNKVLYITYNIVRCSQRDSRVRRDVIVDVAVAKRHGVNQYHMNMRNAIV